ncbi:hypothetical protein BDR07DRAFT_222459 [Suillus spraguei]|nr:hypothetical protein BDR07DRAFT_222459 [Suillus spraguei]
MPWQQSLLTSSLTLGDPSMVARCASSTPQTVPLCVATESGELQVRRPMVFVRYYNNAEATPSSFVEGGTVPAMLGSSRMVSCALAVVSRTPSSFMVSRMVSLSLRPTYGQRRGSHPRSSLQLRTVLLVRRLKNSSFSTRQCSTSMEQTLPRSSLPRIGPFVISVTMVTLPLQFIVPIPVNQMEKTTLGELPCARLTSLFKQGPLAKHIARSDELLSEARGATFVAPSSETEKALAKIYAGIFNLAESETLASDNFFELGGTSIDVIRLKREGSSIIVHSDYHSCQC